MHAWLIIEIVFNILHVDVSLYVLFLAINPSLLSSRNHVGVSPLDMIQDFAFRDEIVNESSSVSKHSLGEMYLPVLGKEHIPPMMEMLLSNIYKHPLDLEDIRKLSSKSYGSRLEWIAWLNI